MTAPAPAVATREYDVAILGSALAGAATAIQLLEQQPGLRVVLIEKTSSFPRKVGEATVEISAYFLGRILGLTQYLNEAHLVKQGMRFWFANERTRSLDQCSEIGGRYLARVAAYQVDRSTLDAEVLRRATALGAQLLRPATVQSIALVPGGLQTLSVRQGDTTETIRARWVVDASGPAALLARQNGWWQANEEHPTTSVWARWRGVKDWDGRELARKFPQWARDCRGIRATATNHFMGDGWWGWCIPLKGGDVSVGVVFDRRRVAWPDGGSLARRLKDFLMRHPAAEEVLREAECVEGDVHYRRHLPCFSTTHAGDGFVLVGDAAAFLDPLYSPGMDWLSLTSHAAVKLVLAAQRGEAVAPLVEQHNRNFTRSQARWFQAIYRDKYDLLGDFELMRTAFLLDLGFYYIGVAGPVYTEGDRALDYGVFVTPPSVPIYHLMRTYNRRLAAIGRGRRARGAFGRRNDRRQFLFGGYTFERNGANLKHLVKALGQWGWLEATEGWRTWFRTTARGQAEPPLPVPAAAPVEV